MRRDKEGCDGVIPFLVVFGWKTSFNVSGEHQQMWDEAILKKKHGQDKKTDTY
jgi:hypothetical protein